MVGTRFDRRRGRPQKKDGGTHASLPNDLDEAAREPLWVALVVALAVTVVVGLEFTVDLSAHRVLREAVVYLDVSLVLGFTLSTLRALWRNREGRAAWLVENRWDLFLVAVALLLLLIVPRVASAFIIGRLVITGLARGLETTFGRAAVRQANLKPTQTLALSFVAVIIVGSLLLTFPAATVDGHGASMTDAVFTITSATCVTGLKVLDTGSYFSTFGQVVILGCIQIGGIGIMVLAAAFAVLVGGRLPIRQQAGLGQLLDVNTPEGLKLLVTSISAITVLTELAGALALFAFWATGLMTAQPGYDSSGASLWWSVFHSIAAFNNAGFSLSPTSIMPWAGNLPVCATIMALITVGGIGFPVLADLANEHVREIRHPRAMWSRLMLQTRVVIVVSLVLNLVGMMLFLFLEYDGALNGLSVPSKLLAAMFQAVTLRTAGFSSVPQGGLTSPTLIFCVVWMFIGASPGSTGGGVKTTTAAAVFTAVRSMLRGRSEVELFGRTVPQTVVYRSLSIVFISGVVVLLLLMLLTATQPLPFEKLIFEAVSAFGTVGKSMDVTPNLDTVGRWLIVALMYIGRVGPLTLALAVGERAQPQGYAFPEGRMAVG